MRQLRARHPIPQRAFHTGKQAGRPSSGVGICTSLKPISTGEDRAFPIFGGINYKRGRRLGLSIVGGVDVGGKLIIEDKNGNEIVSEYHDPAPFIGFAFSLRY